MDYQHEYTRTRDDMTREPHHEIEENGTLTPAEPDTIDSLIDELEALAVEGRRIPFSQTLMIRQDVLLDLVDRLRATVPNNIREAQRVLSQQDQIMEHAQAQAIRILQERGLMQRLEMERQQIISQAEREAEATRYEADAYARDVLLGLKQRVDQIQASVQHGIDTLEREHESQS
jgi:hypothetical protein